MTCSCIPCGECGGSGNVWLSFTGKYLGNHRCDDLDELETCAECHGSGIDEMCDECREKEDEAEWEAAEQYMHPTGLNVRQKEEVWQIVEDKIKKGSA